MKALLIILAITFFVAEATDSPPDFCSLKSETGMCRAYIERFYYDVNQGKCVQFVWGGCGGNQNNFVTIDNCTETCTPKAGAPTFATRQEVQSTTPGGLPSICYLPSEAGTCQDNTVSNMVIRYYFNPKSADCQVFTWSGCGGNSNKFDDLQSCQATCKTAAAATHMIRMATEPTTKTTTTTTTKPKQQSDSASLLAISFRMLVIAAFIHLLG